MITCGKHFRNNGNDLKCSILLNNTCAQKCTRSSQNMVRTLKYSGRLETKKFNYYKSY